MILTASFYDMNQNIFFKKKLFPQFLLIAILHFQVMHNYIHWHCPIDYHIELILVDQTEQTDDTCIKTVINFLDKSTTSHSEWNSLKLLMN